MATVAEAGVATRRACTQLSPSRMAPATAAAGNVPRASPLHCSHRGEKGESRPLGDGVYGFGRRDDGVMLWQCTVNAGRIVNVEHTGVTIRKLRLPRTNPPVYEERLERISEMDGRPLAPLFASATTFVVRGTGHGGEADGTYMFSLVD